MHAAWCLSLNLLPPTSLSFPCRHAHNAIRKIDSNHLILGTRYAFLEMPYQVVALEAPYTDVTSYNGYIWIPGLTISDTVKKVHAASGKPVMISEFGFRALENQSGDDNHPGQAGYPVLTEKERADQYTKYIHNLMSLPYVVGFHEVGASVNNMCCRLPLSMLSPSLHSARHSL